MLSNAKRFHFIGIGGIGMSSLACILLERGYSVSGSDIKAGPLTDAITAKGGHIFIGHKAGNVPGDTDIVVYSSSIDKANPEIVRARQRKIQVLHRSDILSALFNSISGIAVAGAHGKTTTTALSSLLLVNAGMDPTIMVGGVVELLGGNWRSGKGDYMVCEADESDGSFLKLKPSCAILTNIDAEHLDYYKNFKAIIDANKEFIDNIKTGGYLITHYGDPNIRAILKRCKGKYLTYGLTQDGPDLYAKNIETSYSRTTFQAVFKGRPFGDFELNVPGIHNVLNSMAVILLGIDLDINKEVIKKTLAEYKGALRRFQVKGDVNDIIVVEDYAHHPTEISATISACKNWPGRRLIGVFQPHRYTRTKFLKKEFGRSFLGLDELVLTDIYAASEKPIEGISKQCIYEEAVKNGQKKISMLEKDQILSYLLKTLKPNDMVLVLGAGDIGELSDELVKGLKHKR